MFSCQMGHDLSQYVLSGQLKTDFQGLDGTPLGFCLFGTQLGCYSRWVKAQKSLTGGVIYL